MPLNRLGPAVLGMATLAVTLLAASTVWLFLANPATVATAAPEGAPLPLVRDIVEVLMQSIRALLGYL
jgi:hypothetical protein